MNTSLMNDSTVFNVKTDHFADFCRNNIYCEQIVYFWIFELFSTISHIFFSVLYFLFFLYILSVFL